MKLCAHKVDVRLLCVKCRQLPLFPSGAGYDRAEGERQRDKGMDRADARASDRASAWRAAAKARIAYLAGTLEPFSADDVTTVVEDAAEHGADSRALGALFSEARRAGLIRHAGFRRTERAASHAGPRSLWRGDWQG